jgi:hypothetical protein
MEKFMHPDFFWSIDKPEGKDLIHSRYIDIIYGMQARRKSLDS